MKKRLFFFLSFFLIIGLSDAFWQRISYEPVFLQMEDGRKRRAAMVFSGDASSAQGLLICSHGTNSHKEVFLPVALLCANLGIASVILDSTILSTEEGIKTRVKEIQRARKALPLISQVSALGHSDGGPPSLAFMVAESHPPNKHRQQVPSAATPPALLVAGEHPEAHTGRRGLFILGSLLSENPPTGIPISGFVGGFDQIFPAEDMIDDFAKIVGPGDRVRVSWLSDHFTEQYDPILLFGLTGAISGLNPPSAFMIGLFLFLFSAAILFSLIAGIQCGLPGMSHKTTTGPMVLRLKNEPKNHGCFGPTPDGTISPSLTAHEGQSPGTSAPDRPPNSFEGAGRLFFSVACFICLVGYCLLHSPNPLAHRPVSATVILCFLMGFQLGFMPCRKHWQPFLIFFFLMEMNIVAGTSFFWKNLGEALPWLPIFILWYPVAWACKLGLFALSLMHRTFPEWFVEIHGSWILLVTLPFAFPRGLKPFVSDLLSQQAKMPNRVDSPSTPTSSKEHSGNLPHYGNSPSISLPVRQISELSPSPGDPSSVQNQKRLALALIAVMGVLWGIRFFQGMIQPEILTAVAGNFLRTLLLPSVYLIFHVLRRKSF